VLQSHERLGVKIRRIRSRKVIASEGDARYGSGNGKQAGNETHGGPLIDLNPVIVYANGQGAIALDALIVLA
jgi:hypothetical protein